MRIAFPTLRTQLALVLLSALVTGAAAVLLIRELLSNTESLLVNETHRQTTLVAEQLQQQLHERLRLERDSPLTLPAPARELSLRGITATVLSGFPALEGGYCLPEARQIAGWVPAAPFRGFMERGSAERGSGERGSTERGSAERGIGEGGGRPRPGFPFPGRDAIWKACEAAARTGKTAVEENSRNWDVWVVAAAPVEAGSGTTRQVAAVSWTMRRLRDVRNPGRLRLNLYLGLLAATTLVTAAGTVAVATSIRRQVNRTKRGVERLENDVSARLPPASGEFGEITEAINRMASHRLELETELRRREQLAVLGRLVAAIAHEVRNPLNNLQLNLEVLARDAATPAAQERCRRLLREIERVEEIVRQLLALVRGDAFERRAEPLTPIIREAAGALAGAADQRGVSFELQMDQDLPPVPANRQQIEQLFVNVLRNAVEAAPRESKVTVRAARQDGTVRVTVVDRGPGLAENTRNMLFQPFFSTKPLGVGLGLAISKQIVDAHGGSIQLESQADGTVVTILLPRGETA